MTYLIIIIALTSVFCYARMLYKEDERMKYRELEGDWTGYEDFYYTTPENITLIEKERDEVLCVDIFNFREYKL